jgi:pimeloyl-ACP methyl ester carboxylesterase
LAYADSDGTRIYWEANGRGEPLVLIMGLGYSSRLWFRLRPSLEQHYRTIVLDNRGSGESDVPPGPYSPLQMAHDVAAVLDAAGEQAAHLVGFSMGGMIAQEFALAYPARVRSLVLVSTHCGGPEAQYAAPHIAVQLFQRADMDSKQSATALVPYSYDRGTAPERIAEDVAVRVATQPTRLGYLAQLRGLMLWSAHHRLRAIIAPTLVLHGEGDQLVPVQNARVLGRAIPGAGVTIVPRAGHMLFTDQPAAATESLLSFLRAVQPSG